MEDIGEVVAERDGHIQVRLPRKKACQQCGMCVAADCADSMQIEIDNTAGAVVGDRVRLSVPRGMVVFASFFVYILPLAGFSLAIIISQRFLPDAQALVLILGFVGLFVCVAISKWVDLSVQKKQRMRITLEKVS